MKKEWIQPFAGGMAVGAIVLLIIIFSAGWVVTQSSAREQTEKMAEKTVLEKLVPICVAQFQQDPNKDQKLKELQAKSSYERGEYVEKQGWATMPASKEPEKKICDQCAERILELASKGK
ncbi:MAG: hypothetical protein KKH04_16695 [Proteobacteria bacterium]|nr:hypothetical protein [Pseudomonadota bacterium]